MGVVVAEIEDEEDVAANNPEDRRVAADLLIAAVVIDAGRIRQVIGAAAFSF